MFSLALCQPTIYTRGIERNTKLGIIKSLNKLSLP
jgi:hypothetical protein